MSEIFECPTSRVLCFPGAIIFLLVATSVPISSSEPGAPNTTDPDSTLQFKRELAPLLEKTCTSCHLTGEEPPGGLALYADASYQSLVNIPSRESAYLRIEPNHPERSYFLMKLEGTHLNFGGSGAQMPLGGKPLPEPFRERIRAWIAAGAPNN
jgi:hypothetical protein